MRPCHCVDARDGSDCEQPPQLPLSEEFAALTGPAAPTNIRKAFASGEP